MCTLCNFLGNKIRFHTDVFFLQLYYFLFNFGGGSLFWGITGWRDEQMSPPDGHVTFVAPPPRKGRFYLDGWLFDAESHTLCVGVNNYVCFERRASHFCNKKLFGTFYIYKIFIKFFFTYQIKFKDFMKKSKRYEKKRNSAHKTHL